MPTKEQLLALYPIPVIDRIDPKELFVAKQVVNLTGISVSMIRACVEACVVFPLRSSVGGSEMGPCFFTNDDILKLAAASVFMNEGISARETRSEFIDPVFVRRTAAEFFTKNGKR